MRKIILVVLVAVVAVGGAGAGWWVYRHVLHDSVAAGEALLAKGEVHAASLELRNAVRNHPENARAHVLLARVQLREGDAVAAEKELKQAQTLHYPGPDLLPLLARAYLGQERFRDLLRDIPVDTLPPAQEAAVLVSRSMAQTALGDMLSARASATAAERLDPTLAEARLAEARILAASGERVQALLKVDEALKLDPKLLEALGLKADVLREQGDLEHAVAALDQAVAVGPNLPRVRVARARLLLLLGEDDKASKDLDVALKGEPKNAIARYLKALLLIRARNWQAADLELQKIQPVLNQLPRGDYYYALVKANINQLEQAVEQATHYTARSPGDPNGFRLLARIDLLLHKQVDATEALKRVAALGGTAEDLPAGASAEVRAAAAGPGTPEGLTQVASRQIDQGDMAAAARDLEQSLETPPKPADTGATKVLSALSAADTGRAQAALDAVRKDPGADPMAVANMTGLVQMGQLDFDGARKTWEDAARQWPKALPLQINLARVEELTDHPAESEKTLAAILTAQPAQGTALRMMIELLTGRHRLGEALTYVKAARRAAPGSVPLLVTEAALHAEMKDFSAAYSVFDEVPLEQAQSPVLLNVRAQIQMAQGNAKDAADSLRQILLGHPNDQQARQRLIQLLVETKQPDEALRLARDGLAQAPGNSTMMQLVVALVNSTQGMDAAQAEAAQLRRDPLNLPAARLLKGALYMVAKQYDKAVAAYQEELKTSPFSALVLATASAMSTDGHSDDAVALLRDWVAKQPDPGVSDTLAAIDITAHRYDQAEKNLLAVLAARPNDAVALNNLAWIYQEQHNPKARALAQRAYLLQPTPQSADTLGWILLQEKKDTPVGLMLVRRAAASMPNDPSVLYHLAVGLKAAGQSDNAAKLVTAVLNSPAKFDERDAAVKLQAELGGPPPTATAAAPAVAAPVAATPQK
jgi:putative PEP-CTERM system TPR-repeat lipoprotein